MKASEAKRRSSGRREQQTKDLLARCRRAIEKAAGRGKTSAKVEVHNEARVPEVAKALTELREQGKIRAIGV